MVAQSPLEIPVELMTQIIALWDQQSPVVFRPGEDGAFVIDLPARAEGSEGLGTATKKPLPPGKDGSDDEEGDLERVLYDQPHGSEALSDGDEARCPPQWRTPPGDQSTAKAKGRRRSPAAERPSTSTGRRAGQGPSTSWGVFHPAAEEQPQAFPTQGPGSSFRRTPDSAYRPRRQGFGESGELPPAAFLPWWTVTGREPNRMERWAAYLLPPLSMGPEFRAIGGEASSRLVVQDDRTFDVISSVTTRYLRVREERRRRGNLRPDQVSIIPLIHSATGSAAVQQRNGGIQSSGSLQTAKYAGGTASSQ